MVQDMVYVLLRVEKVVLDVENIRVSIQLKETLRVLLVTM